MKRLFNDLLFVMKTLLRARLRWSTDLGHSEPLPVPVAFIVINGTKICLRCAESEHSVPSVIQAETTSPIPLVSVKGLITVAALGSQR